MWQRSCDLHKIYMLWYTHDFQPNYIQLVCVLSFVCLFVCLFFAFLLVFNGRSSKDERYKCWLTSLLLNINVKLLQHLCCAFHFMQTLNYIITMLHQCTNMLHLSYHSYSHSYTITQIFISTQAYRRSISAGKPAQTIWWHKYPHLTHTYPRTFNYQHILWLISGGLKVTHPYGQMDR